jgi:ATP-dependent Lhr-like helicase
MERSSRQADFDIARRLPGTWPAFFEHFGRLTQVQRESIPVILEGYDALICSATASGKTEAACAPVLEQHLHRSGNWTVLYISPTRALINDLFARLERPAFRLQLRLQRRTGEYRGDLETIPHLLLTTPESLDSMLVRGKRKKSNDHVLAYVRAVILDEIHLLHGTPRGDQTKWLLERLKRLRKQAKNEGWTIDDHLQIIGLSATVSEPDHIIDSYMPHGKLLKIAGKREIERLKPSLPDGNPTSPSIFKSLPAYIQSLDKSEKIIVFSNARKRVDELAYFFQQPMKEKGYQVLAHHGSLSKSWREQVESIAKQEERIVLFATSTLEIGIDIGDIDVVILDGPPPDVSAFLQRIGRGNRRSNKTRVILCAESSQEMLIQEAMLDAARNGYLGVETRGTHYAVLRQQIASYIMQSPKTYRSRKLIHQLFQREVDSTEMDTLLNYLVAIDELKESSHGISLGEYWLNCAATGEIHTNIEILTGQTVIDDKTGERIASGIRLLGGNRLQTGGHNFQVVNQTGYKLEVRSDKKSGQPTGKWQYVSGPAIKNTMHSALLRWHLGIPDNVWPVVSVDDFDYVFHFGGIQMAILLELLRKCSNMEKAECFATPYYLRIPTTLDHRKPRWMNNVDLHRIKLMVTEQLDQLEYKLGRPSANKYLPESIRMKDVMAWLAVEEKIGMIKESTWEEPEPERFDALTAFL